MHEDDLLNLIAEKLDVYELLDVLGWDMHNLVAALKDDILSYREEFEDTLN